MKICVARQKLVLLLITLIITIFIGIWVFFFDFNQSLKSGLYRLTFGCVIIYIWILFSSWKVKKRVNIFFFLIIMSIPFYLGDQLSLLFGFEKLMLQSDHSILDGIIANYDIFIAMFYLMFSLLFLHIGFLLIYNGKFNETNEKKYSVTRVYSMYIIGVFIYVITLIPAIIARCYDIYMSVMLGHLGLRIEGAATGIFYYFDFLADWFIPSCFIMLIFGKERINKKIPIISIFVYCLLYLLSGSRMDIIGIVFAMLCIYFYWYEKKITKFQKIKILIFLLLLLIIFSAIGKTRNTSSGLELFSLESFLSILDGKFLYRILETTGNTFTSIANAIKCVPAYVEFNNGKSILGSLLYILPSGIREPWMSSIVTHVSSVLSPYYYGWDISGYGSSFITEAYFNYSFFSVFIILFYGCISGWVINKIENFNFNKPFIFYFAIYMVLEMTNSIRNDLYFLPRHIVLYVLLPCILAYFINNVYFKDKYKYDVKLK